jgi:hypothetical protein
MKKHLAQGFKKTHYLTPTNLNNPPEKVDEASAAATDSISTPIEHKEPILVPKLP